MKQKKECKYILIKEVIENSSGQVVRTQMVHELKIYSSNPEVPLTEDIVNTYLDNLVKRTMEEKLGNRYAYIFKDNKISLDLGIGGLDLEEGEHRACVILEVHDEPTSEHFKKEVEKEVV